ncbi:MAG: hypothetical protein U0230_22545 [Polyangiales bacterium]
MRIPSRSVRVALLSASTLLVGLVGCNDAASGTSLVNQATQTENSVATKDCTCNYAADGYASAQACIADLDPLPTSTQASCMGKALDKYPRFKSYLECTINAEKAYDRCLGGSCDPTVWNNCDAQAAAAEDACGEPCSGLTGTSLTDCQNEAVQLFAAIAACGG